MAKPQKAPEKVHENTKTIKTADDIEKVVPLPNYGKAPTRISVQNPRYARHYCLLEDFFTRWAFVENNGKRTRQLASDILKGSIVQLLKQDSMDKNDARMCMLIMQQYEMYERGWNAVKHAVPRTGLRRFSDLKFFRDKGSKLVKNAILDAFGVDADAAVGEDL